MQHCKSHKCTETLQNKRLVDIIIIFFSFSGHCLVARSEEIFQHAEGDMYDNLFQELFKKFSDTLRHSAKPTSTIDHHGYCKFFQPIKYAKLQSLFSVCTVTQWKIKMQTIQYRTSRIRIRRQNVWEMKEDKYTKRLAKNQVCAIFQIRDSEKRFSQVGVPFRDGIAAWYQQKHLFSSFPTNAWIFRLRNS